MPHRSLAGPPVSSIDPGGCHGTHRSVLPPGSHCAKDRARSLSSNLSACSVVRSNGPYPAALYNGLRQHVRIPVARGSDQSAEDRLSFYRKFLR